MNKLYFSGKYINDIKNIKDTADKRVKFIIKQYIKKRI